MKDPRPELLALANALGATCQWQQVAGQQFIVRFQLVHEGAVVLGAPMVGGKGALLGVELFVLLQRRRIAARTQLRRESDLDRIARALAITREMQTGDPIFDRAFYIDSDARDPALQRLLGSPDIRAAITRTMDVLPVSLSFARSLLIVPSSTPPEVRVHVAVGHFRNLPALRQLMSALVDLARVCDRPDPESAGAGPYGRGAPAAAVDETPLPSRGRRWLVAAAMIVVPVLASIALPSGRTLGSGAYTIGFVVGIALWLVYAAVFYFMFRGRSSSLGTVTGAWALGLIVIPFLGAGAEGLNAVLDHGPPSHHVGTARWVTPNKGSGYSLVTATWLPGSPQTHAPPDLWLLGSEGTVPVNVVTRPGALGTPWVSSVSR